jgi:hypothetical protein
MRDRIGSSGKTDANPLPGVCRIEIQQSTDTANGFRQKSLGILAGGKDLLDHELGIKIGNTQLGHCGAQIHFDSQDIIIVLFSFPTRQTIKV